MGDWLWLLRMLLALAALHLVGGWSFGSSVAEPYFIGEDLWHRIGDVGVSLDDVLMDLEHIEVYWVFPPPNYDADGPGLLDEWLQGASWVKIALATLGFVVAVPVVAALIAAGVDAIKDTACWLLVERALMSGDYPRVSTVAARPAQGSREVPHGSLRRVGRASD